MLQKSLVKVARGDKKSLEKVEVKKMEQETTVKKINTITVSSKTFSGRAMVYQCTMCQSRFVDMDDNYRLCPYCGRKIIGIE
jgi:rubrerythrin